MYYILLTLKYNNESQSLITNFINTIQDFQLTNHDGNLNIFENYNTDQYICTCIEIRISQDNYNIIEDYLDILIESSQHHKKIPVIRYLADFLTEDQAEMVTKIGKPLKHLRIHINKMGKKIITQNATKTISL